MKSSIFNIVGSGVISCWDQSMPELLAVELKGYRLVALKKGPPSVKNKGKVMGVWVPSSFFRMSAMWFPLRTT
ncbi:MAG TPA: hypothetical protein VEF34_09670 [Syntrophobacteraceae bacterium]|nr:hypothetical protein [Syntrophobacteraceae bacterium]